MKYIILFLFFTYNNINAQEINSNLVLKPFIIESSLKLSDNNKENLENKLTTILEKNNYLSGGNTRFLFAVKINLTDKQITSTIPSQIILKANMNLFVGDGIDGIKYNNISLNLRGVGGNEEKAIQDLLKNIDVNNKLFHDFISKSNENLLNYYNINCEYLIKKTQSLIDQNKFEEAIFILAQVPENCKDCYNQSSELTKTFYNKKIDYEGSILLNQATNVWISNPQKKTAKEALTILNKINIYSQAYKDALELQKKISNKITDLDLKEWNFKLKISQENYDLSSESIRASKDILIQYAQRKPNFIYNYNLISNW
jgi:hypothetical protein